MRRACPKGQYRGVILTERDQIRFGDAVIGFEVRRSTRRHKTMQLSVDQTVFVWRCPQRLIPTRSPGSSGRRRVGFLTVWLQPALHLVRANCPLRFRTLGETECGRWEWCRSRRRCAFPAWELQVFLPLEMAEGDAAQEIRSAVSEWYWLRALEHVATSVERWWPDLGRGSKPEVLIGDQRKRWGSAPRTVRSGSTGGS